MSLDNNVYEIEISKKEFTISKTYKIISYIIITLFEFMTLLRVNYVLPIDKMSTCYIHLINSDIIKIIENSPNLMSHNVPMNNQSVIFFKVMNGIITTSLSLKGKQKFHFLN